MQKNKYGNLFFKYGIELHAINDNFVFGILLTSPIIMQHYTASYESYLRFNAPEGSLFRGITIDLHYITSMRSMDITGSGGYFFHSILKDVAFTASFSYNFYNTKISILGGFIAPQWIHDLADSYTERYYNYDSVNNTSTYIGSMINLDNYGKIHERFIRMEVAVVF